jgi:TRAP-type C4-dicarboxylate transport system substrate-binding protein
VSSSATASNPAYKNVFFAGASEYQKTNKGGTLMKNGHPQKLLSFQVFCLTLFFCLILIGSSLAAQFNLSYCIFFPKNHPQTKASMNFCQEIERKTNGTVSFSYYPGGQIQRSPHVYDGVDKGIFDMGTSCFAYTKGRFPVMEAVDLPLGYPNGLVASQVANSFAERLQPQELEKVHLLYVHAHGPGLIHSKTPIRLPTDLKGKSIRATGHSVKIINACQAIPIAMAQGESFYALKNHIVEGTLSTLSTLKYYKLAKAINYTTYCECIGYTTAMFVAMNKNIWESFPKDIQTIFRQTSEKWVKVHGQLWDEMDSQGLEYTKDQENTILTLSSQEGQRWKEAIKPVIQQYISTTPNGDTYVKKLRELISNYSHTSKE